MARRHWAVLACSLGTLCDTLGPGHLYCVGLCYTAAMLCHMPCGILMFLVAVVCLLFALKPAGSVSASTLSRLCRAAMP